MKKLTLTLVVWMCLLAPAFAQTVRVKPGGAFLFAAANESSKVVANLQGDSVIEVLKAEGGWLRVRDAQGKREGYVRAQDVEVQKGPGGKSAPTAPGKTAATKRTPGPGAWTDRGFLTLNGVFQGGKSGFSDTLHFPLYQEQASITTQYPLKNAATYSAGLGLRAWRNLGLLVNVSGFTQSKSGELSGTLPKPFVFGELRPLNGTATGLKRQETIVNVEAAWVIPVGRRMLVTLSGGPAFITMKQAVVTRVTFGEVYPYDTASLGSAYTETMSKSKTSVGGGLDLGYYFTHSVGLGAVVRFASATVAVPGGSDTISLKAGGVQAGVGLRVRFGGPKPAKKPAPPKPVPAKPTTPGKTPIKK